MKSRRARYRLLAAVAMVAASLAAVGLVLTTSLLTESPDDASAAAYDALRERQALRADIRGEPAAPSVLGRVAGTTAEEPAAAQEIEPAPVERLRIARIGVEAPVVPMNIDAHGYMEAPHGPDRVAWYDFTTSPGRGTGNAVFSGHLDYRNHGPAVFWDLRTLESGDVIEVHLEDGTRIQYTVVGLQSYPVTTIDMGDILAPTSSETITLITCAGEFIRGDYTERLVVRGVRTGSEPAP